MARVEVKWEPSLGGLFCSVHESRLLGKSRTVPPTEWARITDQERAIAISQLVSWLDEGLAEVSGDGLVIPHPVIARLSESRAERLSLPKLAPYMLSIDHGGTIDQEGFSISGRWIGLNGVPALGAERIGSVLKVGRNVYRLPQILFDVAEAVDAFAAAAQRGREARLVAWARLQEVLPAEAARQIEASDYIARTRIAHAAAFSLSFRPGSDGNLDVDPVLFGPCAAASQDGELAFDQSALVSEREKVLPDVYQEVFAQKRFRAFDRCQAHYPLGEGWYVVIDDDLRQALDIVREVQRASGARRREFARNPRSFLRAALGDEKEERLETLFVETVEFSQRVREIGLWQSPSLPWIQKSVEQWLPERVPPYVRGRIAELEPAKLEALVNEVQIALEEGRSSVKWDDIELDVSQEVLASLQILREHCSKEQRSILELPLINDSGTTPDSQSERIVLRIDENLSQVAFKKDLRPRADLEKLQMPASLRTRLKAHQQEGVQWLIDAWARGLPGVLLADDMGLGKTLQALTFLAWLRERMLEGRIPVGPIGIVAPVGLLKNWQEEHERHFDEPGIGAALIAYGSALRSLRRSTGQETKLGAPVLDADKIRSADLVFTTYEAIRDYQHSVGTVRFAALVFDEAQKVKTPGTLMTEAAKAMNADFVISMTGTPIENRLADLWSIMDLTRPGYLGDLSTFSRAYEGGFDEGALRDLKNRLVQGSSAAPACLLRRMKEDQLDGLPSKEEHVIRLLMPGPQAAAYAQVVAEAQAAENKGAILAALQSLRSVSLHPRHPDECRDFDEYIRESARFIACFQALDKIAEAGERALIFLESLEMQPVLAAIIQRRYRLKHLPRAIHGGVAGAKRQQWVNEFQERQDRGFDVMILSPRAGGVGLTLTAANHVIHLSRWWNPAVEDQCTDRVYRIGQHKRVHVYYPQAVHPDGQLSATSFDLKLQALLEKKRALSREFLVPPVDEGDAELLFRDVVRGSG